jgi:hypothetical protein
MEVVHGEVDRWPAAGSNSGGELEGKRGLPGG